MKAQRAMNAYTTSTQDANARRVGSLDDCMLVQRGRRVPRRKIQSMGRPPVTGTSAPVM